MALGISPAGAFHETTLKNIMGNPSLDLIFPFPPYPSRLMRQS